MSDVSSDRRAPGASRIKYEALVEVGGAHGPSFEAQAIDLSEGGMHLRTQYLPEPGQPLTCRFDMAEGPPIFAAGEVAWVDDGNGEFGLKFTGLDPEAMEAIERVCGPRAAHGGGVDENGELEADVNVTHDEPTFADGARVRLHIEGLGAPMRARVRHADNRELVACSDLAFLQIGRHVEMEHGERGDKRGAQIGAVNVEMDRDGQMPQLVIKLRYAGAEAMHPAAGPTTGIDREAHDGPLAKEKAAMHAASEQAARAMNVAKQSLSKVGPAMIGAFGKARGAVTKLRGQKVGTAESSNVQIRKTSPAPGGGLHTQGRKVIRGEDPSTKSTPDSKHESQEWEPKVGAMAHLARLQPHSAKIAAGGVLVVATILGLVALHKPTATAPLASTDVATQSATGTTTSSADGANAAVTPATATTTLPASGAPGQMAPAAPLAANDPGAATQYGMAAPSETLPPADVEDRPTHARPHHVEPFGNGPVAHGNVIHLKMDGPIEKIEGGVTPNGFSVVIPGCKSLEAAGPLAQRDERIGSIKMSNNGDSAELNVSFRDGVPNYQVRARGDVLEIALAPIGGLATTTAATKHGAHDRQHVEGDKPTRKKRHKH